MIGEIVELVERGLSIPELGQPEHAQFTDLLFSWLRENPREGWVANCFEGALDAMIINIAFRREGEPYKSILMHHIHQGWV